MVKDLCHGKSECKSHTTHHTTTGLAQHLRLFYGFARANDTVEIAGVHLVNLVLDELTEIYGLMLDARPSNRRDYSDRDTSPAIRSPPAYIAWHIRQALAAAAHESQPISKEVPRQTYPRAVGDSEHENSRGGPTLRRRPKV